MRAVVRCPYIPGHAGPVPAPPHSLRRSAQLGQSFALQRIAFGVVLRAAWLLSRSLMRRSTGFPGLENQVLGRLWVRQVSSRGLWRLEALLLHALVHRVRMRWQRQNYLRRRLDLIWQLVQLWRVVLHVRWCAAEAARAATPVIGQLAKLRLLQLVSLQPQHNFPLRLRMRHQPARQ